MTALFTHTRAGGDETAQPAPQLSTAGPIGELLAEITAELRRIDAGEVATYIPKLAGADPADLAVCRWPPSTVSGTARATRTRC